MIEKQVRVGGLVISCCLVAAALLSALGMNTIRVGGGLHLRQQLTNDFVADIMPPPEFIIEPMLEVSELMREPTSLPQRETNLARLEKAFRERASYWKSSELDADLKNKLLSEVAAPADTFWRQ